jgi:hypothetical protein
MKRCMKRSACLFVLGVIVWGLNGESSFDRAAGLIQTAEAVIGRPATPVSYAGVVRRSTVGPGSGIGVLPGAGAGRVGIGRNAGGPVNRVGRL